MNEPEIIKSGSQLAIAHDNAAVYDALRNAGLLKVLGYNGETPYYGKERDDYILCELK